MRSQIGTGSARISTRTRCFSAQPGRSNRMEAVARKNLRTFEEHTRGMKILRFGNIAVVLAMSELLENGTDTNHDVSAYLLVKSEGRWSIVAHAWDQANENNPVPDELR